MKRKTHFETRFWQLLAPSRKCALIVSSIRVYDLHTHNNTQRYLIGCNAQNIVKISHSAITVNTLKQFCTGLYIIYRYFDTLHSNLNYNSVRNYITKWKTYFQQCMQFLRSPAYIFIYFLRASFNRLNIVKLENDNSVIRHH